MADKIRSDGIVIRTDDRNDINCINDIISKSSYIKEGIQNTSPFTFTDGYLSICWDGLLSYNYVISEWIASYINEMKQKEDNNISFLSFYRYVENEYNKIFKPGGKLHPLQVDELIPVDSQMNNKSCQVCYPSNAITDLISGYVKSTYAIYKKENYYDITIRRKNDKIS